MQQDQWPNPAVLMILSCHTGQEQLVEATGMLCQSLLGS